MAARFPARNSDGTFIVAARFRTSTTHPQAYVAAILADAITRREADGAPAFVGEFLRPPVVEWQDEEVLDVVFHGRASSRVWKDWMVFLVRDLETSPYGLRVEVFIDRMSGRPHPSWRRPHP
jgi:hypothetical protein